MVGCLFSPATARSVVRLANYMSVTQSWSVQPATATAIIVIGGYDGSSSLSSGERYEPAQNAWSPIASMGTARSDFAAVAIDGLLYAIGGYDDSGHFSSSGERYDPAQNAWSPIASMGTARNNHAAAVIDGLLYAIGGDGGSEVCGKCAESVQKVCRNLPRTRVLKSPMKCSPRADDRKVCRK